MPDQAERLREIIALQKEKVKSRIIAVTSGKGGVGKTNFSVNFAIALAQQSIKSIVIDADLGLANVDVVLGLVPKYNLSHVIAGEKSINDIVVPGPGGISIVPSGSGLYELASLSDYRLGQILQQFFQLEETTDLIILDTGAGISRNVLRFILAVEEVVILTTPEPTAITDAYSIIKVLAAKNRKVHINVVVNMVNSQKEGELIFTRLATVANRFLDLSLNHLGNILQDAAVSKAVKEQQPFILSYPGCGASHSILKIAESFISSGEKEPHGMGNFFQNMFAILKK